MLKKLLFIATLFPPLVSAQFSIKGTFSPAEEFTWAILYNMTPNNTLYTAQAEIKDGAFEFVLDSTVSKGMYKIVYAVPQEEYNFEVIYNAKEDVILTFSLVNGVEFLSSTENTLLVSYTKNMIQISERIGVFYSQNNENKSELKSLFYTQDSIQTSYENLAKNTLVLHIIKASKPYIPSLYEDAETYIDHLKSNYFSHVNFNDPFLQSSSFLMERTLGYIFGITSEEEEKTLTYKNNIDFIYSLFNGTESKFKKNFFKKMWQKFVNANLEGLANHLATKHLIPLAKELKDTQLVNNLFLFNSLSIGSIAPNFSWKTEDGDKKSQWLSQLAIAENYILVFWSSTCSHCLKELPKLQKLVKTLDEEKYKVIAIGLEDYEPDWKSETYYYPKFIHVLGLGKWENDIGKAYNIDATPTYFLLDTNKKIVAKPKSFEELEGFLKK